MLVAKGEKSNEPWRHVLVNLRVDDHAEPLRELERLLKINNAFDLMNEGDALLAKNLSEAAKEKYSLAAMMAPENEEMPFWQAVTLADTDKLTEALPIFEKVFRKNRDWAELVKRLPASGLLKDDVEMMRKIMAVLER
jgi:tetratricopeptide (TPR) repeat protein